METDPSKAAYGLVYQCLVVSEFCLFMLVTMAATVRSIICMNLTIVSLCIQQDAQAPHRHAAGTSEGPEPTILPGRLSPTGL